jgi:small subunit ribosomal protein S2
MSNITTKELLDSGVHYGHLTRKWDPKMAPYIFMEQNGIHIIDLNKTLSRLEDAMAAAKNIARSGRKILFVSTKKQARDIMQDHSNRVNMPFVVERWLGGMLTNFSTVRQSIKKMHAIEKMANDGTYSHLNKKERLMKDREKTKLSRLLGGIDDLNRLPAALFVVDIKREHIAVKEAQKLNIPIFALVDTNSDPTKVDFPIPGNDDSAKSIEIIVSAFSNAIAEGLDERKKAKEVEKKAADDVQAKKEVTQEEQVAK